MPAKVYTIEAYYEFFVGSSFDWYATVFWIFFVYLAMNSRAETTIKFPIISLKFPEKNIWCEPCDLSIWTFYLELKLFQFLKWLDKKLPITKQ